MGEEQPTVWLVLDVMPGETFEIIGVFDSEAGAVAACREPNHCIGPLTMNATEYSPRVEWAGAYYPKAADGKQNVSI